MSAKAIDLERAYESEGMSDAELDKALERKWWYREQQKSFDLDDEPRADEPGMEYDP